MNESLVCMSECVTVRCSVLECVAVCCGVLQCVAVRCSVLQCVAVCCSVMQCVAVRCSVLQCAAVCCVPVAAACQTVHFERLHITLSGTDENTYSIHAQVCRV